MKLAEIWTGLSPGVGEASVTKWAHSEKIGGDTSLKQPTNQKSSYLGKRRGNWELIYVE